MNPYQPPAVDVAPRAGPVDLELLRNIARHQRTINLAILAQLGLYVLTLILESQQMGVALIVLSFVALAVVVVSVTATVRLANAMHGTGIAIVCAILMFVPCVGLLTLLLLNQQATGRLKKAGFKVGLLGADPNAIR